MLTSLKKLAHNFWDNIVNASIDQQDFSLEDRLKTIWTAPFVVAGSLVATAIGITMVAGGTAVGAIAGTINLAAKSDTIGKIALASGAIELSGAAVSYYGLKTAAIETTTDLATPLAALYQKLRGRDIDKILAKNFRDITRGSSNQVINIATLATNATLDATTHHAEDTQTTTLAEVLD